MSTMYLGKEALVVSLEKEAYSKAGEQGLQQLLVSLWHCQL